MPTGCVGFSTDAQNNCTPHTCLAADRRRLHTHTHTELGALREVKSSALTGLTEALLASLSATTQSFHTSLGSTLELKLVNFHKV